MCRRIRVEAILFSPGTIGDAFPSVAVHGAYGRGHLVTCVLRIWTRDSSLAAYQLPSPTAQDIPLLMGWNGAALKKREEL